MNIVSRSFEATNVIMPPSANSVSGKTSVCMPVFVACARSCTVPGRIAAWATNAPPGSTERSAISNTEPNPSTSNVAHRNSDGESTAIAPASVATPCSGGSDVA